jgi:hypothetical protein
VLEMATPAPLRACLYQVGFDDPHEWRPLTPFKGDHNHKGLIAAPHIIALHRDGRIRVVRMFDGDRPTRLDAVDAMTAYLDSWVALAKFGKRRVPTKAQSQAWIVYDDGARFELAQITNLEDATARRAYSTLGATGLYEATTSEVASLMAPRGTH